MPRSISTRLTTRLLLLAVVVVVLLGSVLVTLVVTVDGQRQATRVAFRSQEALTAGTQLEKSLVSLENGLRGYVASGRERFLAPSREALRQYPAEVRRLRRLVAGDPRQRAAVLALTERIDDYVMLWYRPVIALAEDDLPAAQSAVVTRSGRQRLEAISRDFDRLVSRERALSREREARAEDRSDLALSVGIGGLVLVLVVSATTALHLRHTVLRPVAEVADATGRLASGDLSTRVPTERLDELGDLARAFNTMAGSLERSRSQLAVRTQDLERSNAELEHFASVTSHDLQAPLVTISMYCELLDRSRDPRSDGEMELVGGIRAATQQARELIRALLEYSRAGRGAPDLAPVPSGECVEGCLEALAGPIEHAGARVVVGELPVVLAERSSLCRVFQNLIGNAIKFTDGTVPEVTVEARREDDGWRFCVTDRGIGLDPEHAQRIFQPFQRLHSDEDYDGTGIGLAVCERIVAQHGGRIGVESRPGGGSTFWFTLRGVVEPGPVSAPDARALTTAG